MPTIFTRVIDGELPGTFVWRDERAAAFMSINPLARGHVLVVPTAEVDHWIDLDPDLAGHLFDVSRVIGAAQSAAFHCLRVGLIIAGYEVPHTHLHVIPTDSMRELDFANAAATVEPGELESAAEEIRAQLRAAGREEVVSPA
jgi:diadenosine tetraphosphate (Ap4A) HIT family hydrolase